MPRLEKSYLSMHPCLQADNTSVLFLAMTHDDALLLAADYSHRFCGVLREHVSNNRLDLIDNLHIMC